MSKANETPSSASRRAPPFEWRAALGPWRWLILGTLGVAPGACGARGGGQDSERDAADVQSPPDRAPVTVASPDPGRGLTAGAGASTTGASAGASAGAGSAGSAPEVTFECVHESTLAGGWERCESGMLHRAQPGTCPSELPRPDFSVLGLPAGADAGPAYPCQRDSDCTGTAHGHCQMGEVGSYCAYGCVVDAECGAGQVCLCGTVIGECVVADCSTDADCGPSALCGSYQHQPACGGTRVACQTPEDQCAGDLDCGEFGYCTRELDYSSDPPREAAHRTCATVICAIGRPFLIDGAERLAPSAVRGDWYPGHAAPGASAEREGSEMRRSRLASPNPAVAQGWLEQALMEHASVAAFARFSLQLLQLGAPAELVAAAATGMQDEIRHARACFELARRYSTIDVGPGPLAIDGALEQTDAGAIVLDTLREGCVGETVAALEAAEALQHCEDAAARAVLERIAREEGQHAELAWRFVAWALETRPELTERVREAFARELAGAQRAHERAPRFVAAADRELASHGLLSAPLRAALRERVLAGVVAPCAEALLAGAGWRSPEAASRMSDTARSASSDV